MTLNGEVTNVVNIDRPLSYYSNLLKSATESKNNSISLSSISNDLTITIIEDVLNNNPNINFENMIKIKMAILMPFGLFIIRCMIMSLN